MGKKSLVSGLLVGSLLGVVLAIVYSGYQIIQEFDDASDCYWE
jgi:hypothetical protein